MPLAVLRTETHRTSLASAKTLLTGDKSDFGEKLEDIAWLLYSYPIELRRAMDAIERGEKFAIIPQVSNSPVGTESENGYRSVLIEAGKEIRFILFDGYNRECEQSNFSIKIPDGKTREKKQLLNDLEMVFNQDIRGLKGVSQAEIEKELGDLLQKSGKAVVLVRPDNNTAGFIIGTLFIG